MLTRNYGKIELECDGCEDVLKTDTESFEVAKIFWEGEGWSSSTPDMGKTWQHFCTKCLP